MLAALAVWEEKLHAGIGQLLLGFGRFTRAAITSVPFFRLPLFLFQRNIAIRHLADVQSSQLTTSHGHSSSDYLP